MDKKITYVNPACKNHFPEVTLLQFEHPVLKSLDHNFEKFKTGELLNYEDEVKIGENYYAQRMRLMEENGVIRMFNLDITEMKRAEKIIREKNIAESKNINRTQVVNKDLKEIAGSAKIDFNITTYVARHTYATIMKRSGASTAVISESLGHDSEKTTQIYLDSFENKILDEANKAIL